MFTPMQLFTLATAEREMGQGAGYTKVAQIVPELWNRLSACQCPARLERTKLRKRIANGALRQGTDWNGYAHGTRCDVRKALARIRHGTFCIAGRCFAITQMTSEFLGSETMSLFRNSSNCFIWTSVSFVRNRLFYKQRIGSKKRAAKADPSCYCSNEARVQKWLWYFLANIGHEVTICTTWATHNSDIALVQSKVPLVSRHGLAETENYWI